MDKTADEDVLNFKLKYANIMKNESPAVSDADMETDNKELAIAIVNTIRHNNLRKSLNGYIPRNNIVKYDELIADVNKYCENERSVKDTETFNNANVHDGTLQKCGYTNNILPKHERSFYRNEASKLDAHITAIKNFSPNNLSTSNPNLYKTKIDYGRKRSISSSTTYSTSSLKTLNRVSMASLASTSRNSTGAFFGDFEVKRFKSSNILSKCTHSSFFKPYIIILVIVLIIVIICVILTPVIWRMAQSSKGNSSTVFENGHANNSHMNNQTNNNSHLNNQTNNNSHLNNQTNNNSTSTEHFNISTNSPIDLPSTESTTQVTSSSVISTISFNSSVLQSQTPYQHSGISNNLSTQFSEMNRSISEENVTVAFSTDHTEYNASTVETLFYNHITTDLSEQITLTPLYVENNDLSSLPNTKSIKLPDISETKVSTAASYSSAFNYLIFLSTDHINLTHEATQMAVNVTNFIANTESIIYNSTVSDTPIYSNISSFITDSEISNETDLSTTNSYSQSTPTTINHKNSYFNVSDNGTMFLDQTIDMSSHKTSSQINIYENVTNQAVNEITTLSSQRMNSSDKMVDVISFQSMQEFNSSESDIEIMSSNAVDNLLSLEEISNSTSELLKSRNATI